MLSRIPLNFIRLTILKNKRILHTCEIAPIFNCQQYNFCPNYSYLQRNPNSIIQKRWKSKKAKNRKDEDSEDEENDENNLTDVDDYLTTKQSKVITAVVPSPRLDVVAKTGFGMSRAKIETAFYDSKLRINGKKCLKKGAMVNVDDEIDLIVSRSESNSAFIIVHRCIVLAINISDEGSTKIKLLRNKSLLIEDYQSRNSEQ